MRRCFDFNYFSSLKKEDAVGFFWVHIVVILGEFLSFLKQIGLIIERNKGRKISWRPQVFFICSNYCAYNVIGQGYVSFVLDYFLPRQQQRITCCDKWKMIVWLTSKCLFTEFCFHGFDLRLTLVSRNRLLFTDRPTEGGTGGGEGIRRGWRGVERGRRGGGEGLATWFQIFREIDRFPSKMIYT